jgi:dTDP-4-amino-4,6-dideoxygalactose transaminase
LQKLAVFEDEIVARQRVAERYADGLDGVVQTQEIEKGATSVWAQYTIRLGNRDQVASRLKEAGIPTAIYYPIPLHRQNVYQQYPTAPAGLPISEKLAEEVLSLPMHPYLKEADQTMIIDAVKTAVAVAGGRKATG